VLLSVCTRYFYVRFVINFSTMVASIDDDTVDSLPDRNISKEFYAKYEPKDVLGRYVYVDYVSWANIVSVD